MKTYEEEIIHKNTERNIKKRIKFIKESYLTNKYNCITIIISLIPLLISRDSQITLKVSGTGMQKVYSNTGCYNKPFDKPNEIYIDDEIQTLTNTHDLNPNNIVKLVWKIEITSCFCLFETCTTIIEMNFSNFVTSTITSMWGMFKDCNSLISLDLSYFDTTNVRNMGAMFFNCKSLTSLDISNFVSSNNCNFGNTFCGCTSLKSINLSNLDTSNIQYMDNMFNGCKNLIYLNLSNFKTSRVVITENMFNDCISLISLDFKDLDMSIVYNYNNMFSNCNKLEYINIKNYRPSSSGRTYFFSECQKNLVVCTEDQELSNIIENYESACNIVNCNENWYEFKKKINNDDGECIEDCNMLDNNKFEYKFKCYPNCPDGTYNNNYKCEDCHQDCKECYGPSSLNNNNCSSCKSIDKFLYLGNCVQTCPRISDSFFLNETISQKICKCELIKCYTCSMESLSNNLCTSCNTEDGYYPIYDDLYINNNPFYNCSKSPEGYYFDEENYVYKSCYESCKSCFKSGDKNEHNCFECKEGYNYQINFDLYKNCYNICSNYYYFNKK